MAIGDMENKLLDELKGMREDFRRVSTEVAGLAVEVKHLAEDLHETKGHGERIRGLETDVSNLKANEQSAATERRWIISLLAGSILSILAIIVTIIIKFAH